MRLIDAAKCPCNVCRRRFCKQTDICTEFMIWKATIEDEPVKQWVNIADEKPPRRGNYFVAYKFQGSDMRFYGEAFWHDDIPSNGYVNGDHFSNEGVDGMYVTHWMGIPKLPACGAKMDMDGEENETD